MAHAQIGRSVRALSGRAWLRPAVAGAFGAGRVVAGAAAAVGPHAAGVAPARNHTGSGFHNRREPLAKMMYITPDPEVTPPPLPPKPTPT